MTPALRSEVDQCKQRLKEEREAEAKADDLKKERAANIAAEWGLPWPPPDRKGKWGRMSNESKLYAQIPCGIEQEPSYPPPSGKSSSTSSSLAESSDLPVGNKDTGVFVRLFRNNTPWSVVVTAQECYSQHP
ncbi:hypothetical protein EMCRGX_G007989 [Ephydatia muelleri]